MPKLYPPTPDEIRLWELASGDDNRITDWDDTSIREYQALLDKIHGGTQVPEKGKRRNRVADKVTRVLEGTAAA